MSFRLAILSIILLHVLYSGSAEASPVRNGTITPVKAHNDTTEPRKAGWTAQPNGRGTLDILWSCSFTMFLCSWSALCLNAPGPTDSPFHIFRRKLYMSTLAFVGPEFLFQIALSQYISAKRSVHDMHSLGHEGWTLRHAFFADMGGFVLHSRDFVPFPIDAKQLHYLVTESYVQLPTISLRTLKDRNKVDGLLRLVTLCQTLWFVVQICGRAYQHLAITCLELTTAGFIVCSVGTTFCWASKPAGILTSEVIATDVSIADILVKAGERARKPYTHTPLDFVNRREWPWSMYWSNWINILRNMRIDFGSGLIPLDRFGNANVLELSAGMNYVFLGVTAVYSAIFISGWNYNFPTYTEQILWRAASATVMGTLVGYWFVTEFAFSIYPAVKRRFAPTRPIAIAPPSPQPNQRRRRYCSHITHTLKSIAACIRNNSISKDPALDLPLKAILPIYVVAVFYCHARTYMYVADIIELRSLPRSAYQSVDWTSIFPHI